jgi:uncharacterized protein
MKNLLKTALLGLVSLLYCIPSFAQPKKEFSNSLLWKISKKGNTHASYLFGTIHVICEQDYFWTKAMQQAFDQTEQLCLEMDISNSAISAETAGLMLDLTGGTLRDYFDQEADYQLVKHYIEDSLGQNMQIAERMKPIALYMIYSIGMVKGACQESVSYELKLAEQAKDKKYQILGLETVAEQMEAMESLPTDRIISHMIQIDKGQKSDSKEAEQMVTEYKKQNINALNKLIVQSTTESGMNGDIFVNNRNKKWIAPMSKMMSEKATFFAVGAGHVYGLLQLLQEAGYTVEAVR